MKTIEAQLIKRIKEYEKLLRASLGILNSKQVIVLKKDDVFLSALDNYRARLKEYGIE